jgi:hypothetical protein
MSIFLNHLGWEPADPKVAVVRQEPEVLTGEFRVVDAHRTVVAAGTLVTVGPVARWGGTYHTADFSAVTAPGRYRLVVPCRSGEPLVSDSFEVSEGLYRREILTDLLHYFKSQRSSHIWDRADRSAPLWGTGETFDVHGGWYDASGDVSKYLSHLSYANFLNPQQTPLVVWNLLDAAGRLGTMPPFFRDRLTDEALYGADFLVRMQHPSGAFFMTLFDQWSKDPSRRHLCAYATRSGTKLESWQASYRQGGGMAVAALARASTLGTGADFGPGDYLAAAKKGFEALEAHGPSWCDDGVENLIDDECALMAAAELFAATGDPLYAAAGERRAAQLVGRLTPGGWWRADATGDRSFYHASDAGLPVVALLRWRQVRPWSGTAGDDPVLKAVEASLRYELAITRGVPNPFGYPRQYVKPAGQPGRVQWFIPHENESGYWWQGENARLGSLASAAFLAAGVLPDLAGDLRTYGRACLDWVFGRNPFDLGMMHGKGHHNPQYEPGYYPAPGGICNGITSALDDDEGIAFHRTEDEGIGPWESWRWGEQWLPHGAWMFLAVSLR